MIIAMGLPGAGKTTVLQKLQGEYKILNYGDLMLEIEKEKGWVQTRDEMRKLPVGRQREAQQIVAKRLAKEKGKVILDTHCSIATPQGYYPGLPFEFLKWLQVDALIYITAGIKEIEERRKNDPIRTRDVDDVAEHDSINRSFLAAYSAFTGAPSIILYNKQGRLEETVKKLSGLLK
ncbi:MAG TPA: adenylate kinase [Candidatus Bilamarchaeaceae archaeon]|nr:adenylate kinase [Candidatus Bilamarchaeaceae archaeon]